MEYAKKMALVEPRLLESFQQQQHHHQHHPHAMLDKELCQLDQSMQEILDCKDVFQEQKLKLNHQILQKYLLYNKQVEPIEMTVAETKVLLSMPAAGMTEKVDPIETDIIESAPTKLNQKASLLMRRIKQGGLIG